MERIKIRPNHNEVYYIYLDTLKAVYLAEGVKEISYFNDIVEVLDFIKFCKQQGWKVFEEALESANS